MSARNVAMLGILAGALLAGCPGIKNGDICEVYNCGDGDAGNDGGTVPPGCDVTLEPKDSLACVDDRMGTFASASAGNDGNPGTKELPTKTIGAALTKAGANGLARVYVCEGTYDEPVKVDKTISIYAGFACDWHYSGTRAQVTSAPPANATIAARNKAPEAAPSRPERQPETELTASTIVNASTHSTSEAANAAPTTAAFCISPGSSMITPI